MDRSFQRICILLVALAWAVLPGVAVAASARTTAPMCGAQSCAAVAKPIALSGIHNSRGVVVVAGSGLLLRIPAGYRQIAHNGTVDVYGYPAAAGHKELLLHATSVSAFGNLGAHDDWRVFRRDGIVTFFRPVKSPSGWNGFVVYRSAKPRGDAMLELYAVGFSKVQFEAMMTGIKVKG